MSEHFIKEQKASFVGCFTKKIKVYSEVSRTKSNMISGPHSNHRPHHFADTHRKFKSKSQF